LSFSQSIPPALAEVIELELRISVIVIYLLFVICDLEFFTETYKFPLRSNWRRRPEAVLIPEPRAYNPSTFNPELSYETTPKWHGFLLIKLDASAASGGAEPWTWLNSNFVAAEVLHWG
jgi:hypothetical protein